MLLEEHLFWKGSLQSLDPSAVGPGRGHPEEGTWRRGTCPSLGVQRTGVELNL